MKEQDKNNIDHLFKDGFDNAGGNLPYQEHDWHAMEKMLDRDKKRGAILTKLPIILSAVAAMLILAIGLFFLNGDNAIDKTKLKHVKVISSIHKDTGTYGRPVQQPADLKLINPLSENEKAIYIAKDKNRESKSFFTLSAAAVGRNITGVIANKKSFVVQQDTTPTRLTANTITSVNHTVPNTTTKKQTITNAPDKQPPTSEIIAGIIKDTTEIITVAKKLKARKTSETTIFKQGPRLSLSFVISPDINSTGGFSQNKVGTNAGLLLTLGVSKKWNISTGVIYADKPYMTAFSNYATTYKFNTNPASVTASCIVLDIPINLGYQVYNRGGNKFSLGTGLSSYFMLRENYTYTYTGSGPNSPLTYNIANKNKTLLGVLNLNATYQRAVSSKFDIEVQPYFKLPLTGIGYGQVNLKSAGVAVGVIWNFNPLTKP